MFDTPRVHLRARGLHKLCMRCGAGSGLACVFSFLTGLLGATPMFAIPRVNVCTHLRSGVPHRLRVRHGEGLVFK